MDKKELVEKIESLPSLTSITSIRPYVDKKVVLGLISQLDEPEKVKVSEEEAKFLETFDFNCEIDVTEALYYVSRTGWGYHLTDKDNTELKHLSEGFRELENRKRLIKAILDGYEVEKEKRYTIRFKNIRKETRYLKYDRVVENWYFGVEQCSKETKISHTRTELEEVGFGWVFDCEGIEIREVTE